MEIIDTINQYLADAAIDNLGIIIVLTVGASCMFLMIRNHKSNVSHKIAYRKTEFLTKLEDLIKEFKTYVYSFDAETYSQRKQSNESFLTAKSYRINARLEELYKIQATLEKKQFDNIDSVENAQREINRYINSTHRMMIRLGRRTSNNRNSYSPSGVSDKLR